MSSPRWIAVKVPDHLLPWSVCQLTDAEGGTDYREVAAFKSLREATGDIDRRKAKAATSRTTEWRRRVRKKGK